jgi:hypothetical protein
MLAFVNHFPLPLLPNTHFFSYLPFLTLSAAPSPCCAKSRFCGC